MHLAWGRVRLRELKQPPLQVDGFDLAVLQHVLCCAQQPRDLLEEVRAALKPGDPGRNYKQIHT